MRRKLELLKLQIKSAFLSIPKIILGTIVTAVLVIAISTCIGIATAQDSDMRMKVAVVYPDYNGTDNKEFKLIKNGYIFEFNYNFGHINVDNELTGECEDCIEVGMGIIFPDQQSFESKCNEWLRKRR